jgi:hypothetical protein
VTLVSSARVQALLTDMYAKTSYTLRMACMIRTHSENDMCNCYTHLGSYCILEHVRAVH